MTVVREPDRGHSQRNARQSNSRQKSGRLTVFFSMAPGVGKTCAMLKAAGEEALAGRDVVIGCVQTP